MVKPSSKPNINAKELEIELIKLLNGFLIGKDRTGQEIFEVIGILETKKSEIIERLMT